MINVYVTDNLSITRIHIHLCFHRLLELYDENETANEEHVILHDLQNPRKPWKTRASWLVSRKKISSNYLRPP